MGDRRAGCGGPTRSGRSTRQGRSVRSGRSGRSGDRGGSERRGRDGCCRQRIEVGESRPAAAEVFRLGVVSSPQPRVAPGIARVAPTIRHCRMRTCRPESLSGTAVCAVWTPPLARADLARRPPAFFLVSLPLAESRPRAQHAVLSASVVTLRNRAESGRCAGGRARAGRLFINRRTRRGFADELSVF